MIFADSLRNLVANIGTDRDKASAGSFVYSPIAFDQITAMYRGTWLGRKIVDIIPDDMTREWRDWEGENDSAEQLEAAERALRLRSKIADAMRWARLYGGAGIYLGYSDGQPGNPAPKSGEVQFAHVLPRHQMSIEDMDLDPLSLGYGEPTFYLVSGGASAMVRVHPSRIIPVIGNRRPPDGSSIADPWGDSIFDVLADPITRSATASSAMAALLLEAKVDVITISGLATHLETSEGTERLKARFTLAALMKGINGTLLLGEGESYDPKTISFTGIPDVHARFLQEVSGAADIPLTRLLGQSPAGLNSTGESDLRNYYDGIRSRQELDLRPILDRIDAAIFPSTKTAYAFPSLWQMTEKDKAEVLDKTASAVKRIAETGIIDDALLGQALARKLDEDGSLPGLEASEQDDVEFAANDAAPRTLYVSRKLLNSSEFISWAKSQGFKSTISADDLHVTLAFSRAKVDWMRAESGWSDNQSGELTIGPGGARLVEHLGDKGAVVLLFASSSLQYRWGELRRAGCSWDHGDEYQPHVTITYDPGSVDLSKVCPYQGKLVFGPEIFEELNEDWVASVSED